MEIHLKSPRGWINDPNGFIFYKGKYHLFYQHFPYAPVWGRMHWGHAVSSDLLNWQHLNTALFPSKTDDCDGCFSGSAIGHGGKMHIFYTGVRYDLPNPENTNCCLDDKFTAAQLHIASDDGYAFDNFKGKTTVISPLNEPERGCRTHTRDPKVWRGNDGNFYMVLGTSALYDASKPAGCPDVPSRSVGRLLFYKSADLENWEYVNYAEREGLGWMWECPDYFRTDDSDVLICSPIGIAGGSQTVCSLVKFEEEGCRMEIPDEYQFFDYGLDLYAPQSTIDENKKRTVIAWLRMPKPMKDGNIGMFCIPRICEVKKRHIYFRPHPNIQNRFTKKLNSPEKICMIRMKLFEGEEADVCGFTIMRKNGIIITDRSKVFSPCEGFKTICETPEIKDGYDLEIYMDEYLIEVFVNSGEYVISNAVYNLTDSISAGNAEIFGIEE